MNLNYVDIFYHHRPDPGTPLEETMGVLDQIVRFGKALYVGISNYGSEEAKRAIAILRELGTPCLIHQPNYSMLNRSIEYGLTKVLKEEKVGCMAFGALAGGKLTGKYIGGIPEDSRAVRDARFLTPDSIKEEENQKVARLSEIAAERGQKMSQMALSWALRDTVVTSALIGASRPEQVIENVQAIEHTTFEKEELERIDAILEG